MRAKLFLLLAVFSTLPLRAARSQTVVTFDDIVVRPLLEYTNVPSFYHGLSWSNFGVLTPTYTDGYCYGMVSAPNVAFNGSGDPAEVDSLGTNFNFLSAYFTGAFNSNLNIEVQGFRDTNVIYDETLVAAATNPTLFTLNFLDIDRLTFNSFGGQSAGFTAGYGNIFVMDNFMFEFIPEPSSLLLTILGVLTLWACCKRRTA
jgi:hypothetical protein